MHRAGVGTDADLGTDIDSRRPFHPHTNPTAAVRLYQDPSFCAKVLDTIDTPLDLSWWRNKSEVLEVYADITILSHHALSEPDPPWADGSNTTGL
jgi:hypothetical protein